MRDDRCQQCKWGTLPSLLSLHNPLGCLQNSPNVGKGRGENDSIDRQGRDRRSRGVALTSKFQKDPGSNLPSEKSVSRESVTPPAESAGNSKSEA